MGVPPIVVEIIKNDEILRSAFETDINGPQTIEEQTALLYVLDMINESGKTKELVYIVGLLLKYGADPLLCDAYGKDAFDYDKVGVWDEVLEYYIQA